MSTTSISLTCISLQQACRRCTWTQRSGRRQDKTAEVRPDATLRGHALTCRCHSLLTIFQELAAFREDAEAFRRDVQHGFTMSVFSELITRTVTINWLSRLRLANTIEGLKPTPTYIDPMTKFWTVYQEAADEYDGTLLKKYARDLDTSLLFVSTFISLVCPTPFLFWLGWSLCCCLHGFHRPNRSIDSARSLRSNERPVASDIATQRFVWRIRPAGTRREHFLQCRQSPVDPLFQFGCDATRGLHHCIGETVGHVLSSVLGVGEHH